MTDDKYACYRKLRAEGKTEDQAWAIVNADEKEKAKKKLNN